MLFFSESYVIIIRQIEIHSQIERRRLTVTSIMKRISAALAAVLFVLVVFCSSVFIAVHGHHHCTDEDCVVCMELEQCRDSLNTLGASLPAIVFAAAVMVLFVILAAAAVKCLNGSTLISLKVELLD